MHRLTLAFIALLAIRPLFSPFVTNNIKEIRLMHIYHFSAFTDHVTQKVVKKISDRSNQRAE